MKMVNLVLYLVVKMLCVDMFQFVEVVSVFSVVFDMMDGQLVGYSVCCCWIGMYIGE